MANTANVNRSGQVTTVTYSGTGADFLASTDIPAKLDLTAIIWVPSAANDVLVVREGASDGPIICKATAIDTGSIYMPLGLPIRCNPCIVLAQQTFSDPTDVVVTFVEGKI